jgi:hypothetical protein
MCFYCGIRRWKFALTAKEFVSIATGVSSSSTRIFDLSVRPTFIPVLRVAQEGGFPQAVLKPKPWEWIISFRIYVNTVLLREHILPPLA